MTQNTFGIKIPPGACLVLKSYSYKVALFSGEATQSSEGAVDARDGPWAPIPHEKTLVT